MHLESCIRFRFDVAVHALSLVERKPKHPVNVLDGVLLLDVSPEV